MLTVCATAVVSSKSWDLWFTWMATCIVSDQVRNVNVKGTPSEPNFGVAMFYKIPPGAHIFSDVPDVDSTGR